MPSSSTTTCPGRAIPWPDCQRRGNQPDFASDLADGTLRTDNRQGIWESCRQIGGCWLTCCCSGE
jgi:hypothetical protein